MHHPARVGKGQGAKEIGHNLACEQPKFGHNLVRERHIIGHSTVQSANDQNSVAIQHMNETRSEHNSMGAVLPVSNCTKKGVGVQSACFVYTVYAQPAHGSQPTRRGTLTK